MQYRKALAYLAVLLWAVGMWTPTVAQIVEERVIARGQVRNLSVAYAHNNRIYAATSSEVMLAIFDPAGSPPQRGVLNYPGNLRHSATAILVDGNYAYIFYETGSQGGKLAVVDVSNPNAPTLAGQLTFPSADPTYISMAKAGNFLYLFPYQGNFAVVNVSNPAAPVEVRKVTATASAGVVVGNRLYTAEGSNGVRIYNITQPDNPTLVATISSVSNIGRVAAANGRLFALRSYNPPLQLHIFDLSNPDAPSLVHSYNTDRIVGLAAVGDYVLISGFEKGTEILSVANPTNPVQVRILPYYDVNNADSVSGRALIRGQSILAWHNPASNQTWRTELPYPIRAVRQGNMVYSIEETRIVAIDISNPAQPSVRGAADLPLQREGYNDIVMIGTNHVAASVAGTLYVYEQAGNTLSEVHQHDPGGFYTPAFGDRLRVSGTTLAMATRLSRVQLYDITNPAAPVPEGVIANTTKFDLHGNFIYSIVRLGAGVWGLAVHNISDPSAPQQLGQVQLPQTQFISDIAAGAGYVLTSDWQGRLALVDARTPNNPQVVAQHTLAGVSSPRIAYDAAVNVFYVYDGQNQKVFMLRVSDFPNLIPVSMTLNRPMYTLSFYGDQIVGAGCGEGLILYRNTLFGGPSIGVTSISPSRGANQGRLTVSILGAGFEQGATVFLESGNQQIQAVEVQFVNNSQLNATFEFSGQPINTQWDVVVRNPNNLQGRLTNGFSIVEAIPTVSSISPPGTRPLSTVTLTINGALFLPGAQVTLLPPENVQVSPIQATNVEYLSQTRLRATFNLSPYQALESVIGNSLGARIQVRNPNNRESNLAAFTLSFPYLTLSAPRSLELPTEATSFSIEATVENSVPNEPLRALLRTWINGQERVIAASQVQSLGNNRWRLTFPADNPVPDGVAETWRLNVQHMGQTAMEALTLYRPYAAKILSLANIDNLQSEARISVRLTNDSPNVTVVLRQGERVIEPSQVSRNADSWRVGATNIDLHYPIRLEDLGDWTAEVRYSGGERTVSLPAAVRVTRGRPIIYNVSSNSWLIWQADHTVTIRGSLFAPQMRVRAVVQNEEGVVDTRVIEAEQISVSEDRQQITARFRFHERLRDGAYLRYEVYSPYTETAAYTDYRRFTTGKVRISNVWTPSFLRAGVGDTFTVQVSVGAMPDAPIVVIPIPFTEQDINAGVWDFEYRIREYSYYPYFERVLDEGRRALNRENSVFIVRLSPMAPFTSRYVEVRVRTIARGRVAQEAPQLRSRVAPAVYLAASGLLIGGAYVLDAACRFASWYSLRLASTIADAAGISYSDAQRWADWLINDPQNARRLLDLYSVGNKSVFEHIMSSLSSEVINEGGRVLREAISIASAQFILDKFSTRITFGSDEYYQFRDQLAEAFTTAYDAYQQIRQAGTSEGAMQAYQNAVNQMHGVILQYAFGEDVLEPPEGIDPSRFSPDTLGIILNVGLSTFLSSAADCLQRNQRLNELYDRIGLSPTPVRTSWDPNEKRGPVGIAGYTGGDSDIVYEILFENLPAATAGAQEVLVEDTLPPTLDESTIEFRMVEVGTKRVVLPEGTTTLNTTIDLTPELPVVVRVRSEYDPATRKLSVRFSGIDPNTNDYYAEGFLPPNQNPPQGEGKVVFRIRPRADVNSGTAIENQAVITFDPHLQANPPITTNTHRITIDKNPPSVAVQVPASSVPETKARLEWQATDDASGVAEVEIWAQEGENARRVGQTRAEGERSETGTVQIRARRFGDETRILARAVDRVGNVAPLGEQPVAVIRMGQAPQFSAGLHLLGIPLRPDAPDLQPFFGFQNNQWATYNPATGQYVQHPDANAAPAIGRGYWVVLPNAVQPDLVGELPDPEQRYAISLQPGWNLIANPWTEPLVWHREAVQVRVQGIARPLSEASEFVEPYLWGWEPNPSNPQQGRYVLVSDAQILPGMQTALQPWRGYWIYAKQACTLELPTPEQAALFAGLTRSYRPEGKDGWSFRIGAQLGDSYDEVLLGVSGNERGLQVSMPPAPPTRSAVSGVQLRLVRDGASMEADLLPRTRSAPTWTLEVHAPPAEGEQRRTLLITTPDLARLPRGVNPVLRDLQTGERRFLRGSAGWQIPVPREGLTRSYEITLINTSRMLRILGVQAQSSRSTGQHTVQFTLSDEARVQITVLSGTQVVRTLEQGRSRSRGAQQVVWDGRDSQGRALPPGTYQILIQAETEDGQLARASLPLILTR